MLKERRVSTLRSFYLPLFMRRAGAPKWYLIKVADQNRFYGSTAATNYRTSSYFCTRYRPRFFDQVGYQNMYASMGNKPFFTKYCHP